jgi:hypothetical protein
MVHNLSPPGKLPAGSLQKKQAVVFSVSVYAEAAGGPDLSRGLLPKRRKPPTNWIFQ